MAAIIMMNRWLLLIEVLVFAFATKSPKEILTSLCVGTKQTIDFTYLNEKNSINLLEVYKTARGIGSGGFGQVKEYKMKKGDMAIKLAEFKNLGEMKLAASELGILIDVNSRDNTIAPPYFGCQFDPNQGSFGAVYIGNLKLAGTLNSMRDKIILNSSKAFFMKLFGSVAWKLGQLWDLGYQHGDIKGANIVLADNGEPFLIDFNLSQKISDQLLCGGTPGYMSSGKRNCANRNPVMYDDMYSLAITMGTILADGGESEVNRDSDNCASKWIPGCEMKYQKKIHNLFVEKNFCPPSTKSSWFSMVLGGTICDALIYWIREEDSFTSFWFGDVGRAFWLWESDYTKINIEKQGKASFLAGTVDLSGLDSSRRLLYTPRNKWRILSKVQTADENTFAQFNGLNSADTYRFQNDPEYRVKLSDTNPIKAVI